MKVLKMERGEWDSGDVSSYTYVPSFAKYLPMHLFRIYNYVPAYYTPNL